MNPIKRAVGVPSLSRLAQKFPNLQFPSELNKWYTASLHKDLKGEWDFNLDWKKSSYPKVRISFIRAIYEAQKEIHQGVRVDVPVLVMHSHQTKNPRKWGKDAQSSDVILDVKDIQKYMKNSGRCHPFVKYPMVCMTWCCQRKPYVTAFTNSYSAGWKLRDYKIALASHVIFIFQ